MVTVSWRGRHLALQQRAKRPCCTMVCSFWHFQLARFYLLYNRPVWNRWRPRVKYNGVILADRLYKIIYGTATAKLSLAVPHFEFRWTFSDVLYFAPIKKVIEFERVTQVCFSRNKVIKSNHLKQKFSFEPFVASNKNSVLQLYFLYFLLSARFTKFTIGSLRSIITDSLRRYALVDSLLFARGRHRS